MADEQVIVAPGEEQPTTAPEASTNDKTETTTGAAEITEASVTATDNVDAAPTDADPAVAEEQTTTEATAPEGTSGEAETAKPDDAAVTPASSKGKRKSSAGVPEHKNKNKRKSILPIISDAQPGDYYFAKFKGFAPWPSIICDESMLPETLLASRPVSALNAQGDLREDFLPGGKNARDRTYPIMFLQTNEFAWLVNTALTPLTDEDVAEDKIKAKMSASLKLAYELARERHDLDFFKNILRVHEKEEKEYQEALAKENAEREEKAAAKKAEAAKPKEKKEKRKSIAKAKESGDDMEVDEKPSSKKRKKAADSDGDETPKAKKTPKTLKLKAEKTPNGDSAKKTDKKKKVVSKPAPEEEKDVLTDAQKFERREKAVLYLRHRLQKGFLTRDVAPKEDEMDAMAEFFSQLESYGVIEPVILRNTKINKVLKGIVKLASIPKEDSHNFKKRSNDLLAQWNAALDQDKGETPAASATPATNGEAKTNGDVAEKKGEDNSEADESKVDVTMADAAEEESQEEKPGETEGKAEETEDKAGETADKTATA